MLLAGAALLVLAIVAGSLAPVREYLLAWLNPATVDNIAVLPLTNLSGDPANDFFADGVTEVLMSRLGMIDSLRVIARSSINAVPAGERDPASLYKRLGARYPWKVRSSAGGTGSDHGSAGRCLDRHAAMDGHVRATSRRHLRAAGGDGHRHGHRGWCEPDG